MGAGPVSEMTYTVSSGTLNSSIPYHTIPYHTIPWVPDRMVSLSMTLSDS